MDIKKECIFYTKLFVQFNIDGLRSVPVNNNFSLNSNKNLVKGFFLSIYSDK